MSENQPLKTQANGKDRITVPDPEVLPQAERRQFSAKYKLRILEEADACREPGEIGALLRREGLYSSHLSKWRQQRAQGQLQALSAHKRGRRHQGAHEKEMAELQRENERLRVRLQQAEMIIEVQKKLSQLLGLRTEEMGREEHP
jgi:transposase